MTTKRRWTYQMLCVGVMIANLVPAPFLPQGAAAQAHYGATAICAVLVAIWLEIAKPGRR